MREYGGQDGPLIPCMKWIRHEAVSVTTSDELKTLTLKMSSIAPPLGANKWSPCDPGDTRRCPDNGRRMHVILYGGNIHIASSLEPCQSWHKASAPTIRRPHRESGKATFHAVGTNIPILVQSWKSSASQVKEDQSSLRIGPCAENRVLSLMICRSRFTPAARVSKSFVLEPIQPRNTYTQHGLNLNMTGATINRRDMEGWSQRSVP